MPEDPLDEFIEESEAIAEIIELVVGIWETVPLFVWILVGIVFIKMLNDLFKVNPGDRTTIPDTGRQRDRTQHEGPAHEEYTIHDNMVDDRHYQPPSESDPIETPNEVDRSILGKIKRLARMGTTRSRDE